MITIKPIQHRNEDRIQVSFKKSPEFITQIKKVTGRRWSKTLNSWHIPYSKSAYNQLISLFGKENIQYKKVHQSSLYLKPSIVSYKDKGGTNRSKVVGNQIIVNQLPNNQLAVYVPFDKTAALHEIKKIKGRKWNDQSLYWALACTPFVIEALKELGSVHFNFDVENLPILLELKNAPTDTPQEENSPQQKALVALEELLILERKSWRTIKSYKTSLKQLFYYYPETLPSQISNQQLKKYLLHRINHDKIKERTHAQMINAFVAFYKRLLKQEVKLKGLNRPKKPKDMPNVFSKDEVKLLLQGIENLKHKTILVLIYSAGLRKSEVINLRKKDILFKRKCIFIKSSKGKKDRYVLLADKATKFLIPYLKNYKPKYWLFEGQTAGQYGERTVQTIFNKAKEKSGVNPYVTLHGLRHSFATHLVEANVPLHVVKELLGHSSIKTTEVYLHISNKYRDSIKSPIDDLGI